MSSGFASSRCAASRLACASTSWLATSSALPPICTERDPPVPPPRGTSSVSECSTRTFSNGTPSVVATICENAVSWPWPCALVPTRAVTVPSSSISTEPNSCVSTIGALISRYDDDADAHEHRGRRARGGPSARRAARRSRRARARASSAFVVLAACRTSAPRPVFGMYGNASGGMKFLRRISTGSMPSSSAAMSRMRSIRWIASGRPAPRYAATGVVFVTTACQLNSTFGITYTFCRHHLREERQERADRRVRAGVGDACTPAGR